MRSPIHSSIFTAYLTASSILLGSPVWGLSASSLVPPSSLMAQTEEATADDVAPAEALADDDPSLEKEQSENELANEKLVEDELVEDELNELANEELAEDELTEEAQRLLQLGQQALEQNDLEGAIAAWQQAFDHYQQLGDLLGEAQTLGNLGYVANQIGAYDQAIALYQTALTIARELDNPELQLNFLASLGLLYSTLNQVEQAIAAYESALPLAEAQENRAGEGAIAGGLAFTYEQAGRYQEAQDFYQLMLEVATEQEDQNSISVAELSLRRVAGAIAAESAAESGSPDEPPQTSPSGSIGIDFSDRANDPNASGPDASGSGVGNANVGNADTGNADTGNADTGNAEIETAADLIAQLQQQLQLARELDDGVTEAITLLQLAGVYRDLDQLALAIATFEQTLERSTALDIPALTEQALLNLASLYQVVGQYERSQQSAQALLTMAEQLGDTISQITALQNLGGVYFATGDMAEAIAAYEKGLTLLQTVDDPFNEAIALALLAEAHLGQQSPDIALELLLEGLAIAQAVKDSELEGAIWGSIGKAHALAGDSDAAIDALRRNLEYEQTVGNLLGRAIAQNNLGTAYFLAYSLADDINHSATNHSATNNLDQAAVHLRDAIALWETQRSAVGPSDPFQISIFETQQQAYQTLQQVLVAQGNTDEALAIAEQGRAQALTALLTSAATPSVPSNEFTDAFTIAQIQQVARDQNATLLLYSITYTPAALFIPGNVAGDVNQTPEADLLIWVVDPSGDIQFRQTPIPRDLATLVADFRQSLGIPSGRNVQLEPVNPEEAQASSNLVSQELYSLLIEPIHDLLPEAAGDRLVILPQQELFLVPFAALKDSDGTYLIEHHALVTAPSIQVLTQVQAVADAMSDTDLGADEVLIVGNPDPMPSLVLSNEAVTAPLPPLPGAQREAEAIASQIFQAEPLIGPVATEVAVTERLPAARLIHLATHGLLEYGNPQTSGIQDIPGAIALAPSTAGLADAGTIPNPNTDGFLTAAELQTMNLRATLAVLSACDTGQGDLRGEGVVGLARSLFAAGVPSVMVSLWAVDDAATADLMTEFYRQWRSPTSATTPDIDKATALRQAILITMEQHPDPRFWAAFTLIGAY